MRKHHKHQLSRLRSHVGYYLGGLSLGVLSILTLMLLLSVVPSETNALDNTSSSTTTRLSVKAVETVAVRLAANMNLDLTPMSTGSFGVADTELGVTTNDPEGFEVFLSSIDHEAALRGTNGQIETITANTVGTSFTGNTWGYSLGKNAASTNTTYKPVPTTSSSVLKANTATVNDEEVYHLGFGVHITPSLPAGEYSSSVLVSVVANPATISSLGELVYMQDMTPELCQNTYPTATDLVSMTDEEKTEAKLHPITKQLYDVRDGKKYWVAKLADGNCWMTQNLAFDLKEGQVLTSADTDVTEDWVVPVGTETSVPNKNTFVSSPEASNSSYYTSRSWDMGKFVLATPLRGVACSALAPGDSLAGCDNLQDVSSWKDTFIATTGTWKGEMAGNGNDASAEGLVAVNPTAMTYDAHYLVGNYYQYNAAAAGGATASVGAKQEVKTSICPAGWRLPSSGNMTNESGTIGATTYDAFMGQKYSFYNLLKEYGYSNEKGYTWANSKILRTAAISGSVADNYLGNIASAPLYFGRSGNVTLLEGLLKDVGQAINAWSSTSSSNIEAYYLNANSSTVYPAFYVGRYLGFAVRCVAK